MGNGEGSKFKLCDYVFTIYNNLYAFMKKNPPSVFVYILSLYFSHYLYRWKLLFKIQLLIQFNFFFSYIVFCFFRNSMFKTF